MPKIVDHNQKRLEIFDASFDVFAKQGYAALSMRQLAKSLGVTTGTLYHYFPSKTSLFYSLFHRLQEEDLLAASNEFSEASQPRERAKALGSYLRSRGPRLTKALQIALEYQRVQPQERSQEFLEQTILAYQGALKENLKLQNKESSELLLSLIFGMLIHASLAPQASSLDSQLSIIEGIYLTLLPENKP